MNVCMEDNIHVVHSPCHLELNVVVDVLTLGSNGDQFHSLACDEAQRFVHVVDFVDPHLASLRLG